MLSKPVEAYDYVDPFVAKIANFVAWKGNREV